MTPEMIARTKYFLALAEKSDEELRAECVRLVEQRASDLRKLHRVREVQEHRACGRSLATVQNT